MKLMTVESIFINGFEKAECVGAIFNLIDLTHCRLAQLSKLKKTKYEYSSKM